MAASFLASIGFAQGAEVTGADLKAACSAPATSTDFAFCKGFVSGAADTITMFHKSMFGFKLMCKPSDETTEQLIAVVNKNLEDHPDALQQDAVVLVQAFLVRTFPCPKR